MGRHFILVALAAFAAMLSNAQPSGVEANNRGVELRLASRPADAVQEFNRAIQIAENSGDDRLLATALAGLGSALVELGEFARAQPVLRRSLALFEKIAGPDSLETGEAANNLAMLYRKTGEFSKAQEQMERALPRMQAHLDPGDMQLALALNNMFIILVEQKQWDRAEPYLEQAREIAKDHAESSQFADIEENRALLLAHRGQYREAVETMREVLTIEQHTLRPDDPRVARSLESYAGYLRKISEKSEARRAELRAQSIRRAGS